MRERHGKVCSLVYWLRDYYYYYLSICLYVHVLLCIFVFCYEMWSCSVVVECRLYTEWCVGVCT